MKPISRRSLIALLAALAVTFGLLLPTAASAQSDPLPSWNDGPAKQAIVNFVKATTDQSNPDFVPARGADRHLRSGWDAVGRSSDVHPGGVLPGAGPRPRQGKAGTGQCRAL